MSVIEIIEFTTHPNVERRDLEHALEALDHELRAIGGFQSRDLYRAADVDDGWILDYRWDTLTTAQTSMGMVAGTDAFTHLMTLINKPETMRMTYGTPE
ncbi:hypothetical protein [Rhodococcus sp. AG1013]|uniref:hypothetical protein n=1 Tax=unclassified Rhodococcus (in: high G+C Gram-positive bacteria) TaxID=192944 RepID=UPI000E0C6D35|nr:hypothetical protein [Rhodococcus sp. AG1013]RDI23140.1 hypothetical protein DEU38_1124 [Rhodococcus sp. AG1013]